ncbi:hypothetical protein [Bdellovibrio bacteriovorus]|uniref:hypothetical protein n=1 Tax=Bdellovibrio bacteriovorus TaxID=959 RepID=UPI0035A61EFD
MKKTMILLSTLMISISAQAVELTDRCPSESNKLYTEYALPNAQSYFWAFLDKFKTRPNPTRSMVTLVDIQNPEKFLLLVFDRKTIFSWSHASGTSAGAAFYLPRIEKMIDDGASLCSRSTTELGVKQLMHLLQTGTLDPKLSNQ